MQSESTSTIKKRKSRKRAPKHPVVTRAYRFAMDTTKAQSARLFEVLHSCHTLRNTLGSGPHREPGGQQGNQAGYPAGIEAIHYLNRADQYQAVSLYSKTDPMLSKIQSQVKQNIAHRVDEGYKRRFDALKEGRTGVNPPRVIDQKKYRSFSFPQYGSGAHIKNGTVFLWGLGEFHIRDHRKIRGLRKTVTVKWSQGKWWCIVTVAIKEKDQVDLAPLTVTVGVRPDAGADPGLTTLLADSHGVTHDPPRAYRNGEKALNYARRDVSRKFEARKKHHKELAAQAKASGTPVPELRSLPFSRRLKDQIRKVATLHTKFENTRDHFHKKIASIFDAQYRQIAVEEHGVQFMLRKRRTAKSAADRGVAKQKRLFRSKLGPRYHETANQRPGIGGRSQSCLCGASVAKELSGRAHRCPECGLVADRDHVSANIAQFLAFGTISETLHYLGPEPVRFRHTGSMSSCVEGSKPNAAKTNP